MLRGLRNAGQSWLGKIVVGVLFGLLIISFAVWGIGDVFRGAGRNTLATVGDREITITQYRDTFTNELLRLGRQIGRNITNEQAIQAGIDRQVLGKLVTEAALDQRARDLGLAISDKTIARAILDDPTFKGTDGTFSRALFDDILRGNNLTEQAFVREQRSVYLRQQIADTIAGGFDAPVALKEVIHRVRNEARDVTWFRIGREQVGEIAAPDEATLKAYFESRKAEFRAPALRAVNVVAVRPQDVAKPESVSAEALATRYEAVKTRRFGSPERRVIEQIAFPDDAAARAALGRIRAGTAFAEIGRERGIAESDLRLGTFARADMFDAAVAEAAFALKAGEVGDVVVGRFGPVLVRVAEIVPEAVKPLAEVEAELRREIAIEQARDSVRDLHDRIEDQRASARPLADIAREFGLNLLTLDPVDALGRDGKGVQIAGIPEAEALLRASFATEVGADNEPLSTRDGGWVWYDVTRIDSARDRTFEEAREAVLAVWMRDELSKRLATRASELARKVQGGASLESVAAEVSARVETASGLTRASRPAGLEQAVVERIFTTPVGTAAAAVVDGEAGRIVFRVTGASVPEFLTTTSEAEQIGRQLRIALADDLLVSYVARLEKDYGVTLNEPAFRAAVRGTSDF
jgi:peptidyl-prolyl cis-trans isomerase D